MKKILSVAIFTLFASGIFAQSFPDIEVRGTVKTDTITEKTTDAGVTIESVNLKDGAITSGSIDADDVTITNIEVDNLKSGVLDTDLSSVSGSDDTIPSAKATKAALDEKVTGPASCNTQTIPVFSDTTGKIVEATPLGITPATGKLNFPVNNSTGAYNLTPRSTEPATPYQYDAYLDDGTNTASGNLSWRQYNGVAWEDIGAITAGDMFKSTYDTDDDGTVDSADIADDVDISGWAAQASPASGMKFLIDDSGTRKYVDYDYLPGASGGEVNTASNTGSSGVGIYKQKSTYDLEFYKLLGANGVSIALDGTDKIDVGLDIPTLTEESSPASGDYFVMYKTGTGYRKVDSDNMPGSGSGGGEYGTASDLTLSSGSVTPTATTHKFSVIPENYAGSTMTASPSATDTTITVTSGTNFAQGQRVKIQDNTYSEYGWIKSVSSNTLTLYSGLTNGYDHTDGGEVLIMSDTLTTLAATNVNEGTVILVKPKYDGSIIEVDNGGGNIIVPDGCNAYLPTTGETMFVYDGSNWKMLNNYGVLFEDIVIFFDNSMSASTINGLSASVPRNMGPNNLTFQFLDGTYSALSEALSFNGFIGSGTLSILGNSGDYSLSTSKSVELQFSAGLNGINILNNTNSIIALYALKISIQQQSGVTISGINSNGNSAYTYCRFNYILCDGKTYTSYGIYVNYNPGTFWAQSNYVSNLTTGIYASNCGNVISTSNDDTGTAPNYGLAANGTTIHGNTTQPDGTITPTNTLGGGVISLN